MTTTSAELPASLEKIVQRLQATADPKQKYERLIWFAKKLPEFPEADKTAANKVSGCTSQVYITAQMSDGKMQFSGDSDSQLVKGLVAILVEGLNGLAPETVLKLTPDFIQTTGLNVSLTPSRVNGFYNIFQMMQQKTLLLSGQATN
jgi:cysteine desulfuration protein SufE